MHLVGSLSRQEAIKGGSKFASNILANLCSINTENKKSPRGIRPRRYSPSPQGAKYVTVKQDMSLRGKAEVCDEHLFGRAKIGGLGQVTTKKHNKKSPRGIRARRFPLPLRVQNTLRSLEVRGQVV